MKKEIVQNFLSIKSPEELANFLGISYSSLIHLLFNKKNESINRYKHFKIPKKNGSWREISVPNNHLSFVQRSLLRVLSDIYHPPKNVHGFIKAFRDDSNNRIVRNIITNAKFHINRKYILNIDLKDFFQSINSRRIFSLFVKPPFNFSNQVAGLLTEILIDDNTKSLPQGAPTSPIISNMICKRLDRKLSEFAILNKILYSRYADDLTFSSRRLAFDNRTISEIIKIINEEGFNINYNKIRVLTKKCRQEVTGLVVNEKVNVNRRYLKKIRAMLNNWREHGLEYCNKILSEKYKNIDRSKFVKFENVLWGMIDFVGQVRGKTFEEDQYGYYLKFKLEFLTLMNDVKVSKNHIKKVVDFLKKYQCKNFDFNKRFIEDLTNKDLKNILGIPFGFVLLASILNERYQLKINLWETSFHSNSRYADLPDE